ncbi:MAG: pyruvate ferredoxin oxidoreductase [Candidatus Schekmanbacteria bacterium]|nr:MAG: pyruvate ferredoxin oxidoreductase [Candidatus Schekmanbacteria bacterium]
MRKVLMANHAVSIGVKLSRVSVVAAYPITPQSQVVELISEMCADGEIDAKFLKVESEHSAMACCIGAALGGSRVFTATSSQGLLLMHEMLHWAAGSRVPIVMTNVNRSVSPPWSIWTDQTDSLSQRDTGWIQLYCESNQEVLDSIIQAYWIAEKVNLPFMVVFDGFYLSHTNEAVDIPEQSDVDRFLRKFRPKFKIDVKKPHAFNSIVYPDAYMEFRHMIKESMDTVPAVVNKCGAEFGKKFGRVYGTLEEYRNEDAEISLITSSTVTSTARIVIDEYRKKGIKAGLIKLRLFNPFPREDILNAIRGKRKVGVIDRNYSPGNGGVFAQTLRANIIGNGDIPEIYPFIVGLGGRDVHLGVLNEAIDIMASNKKIKAGEEIWLDLKK